MASKNRQISLQKERIGGRQAVAWRPTIGFFLQKGGGFDSQVFSNTSVFNYEEILSKDTFILYGFL